MKIHARRCWYANGWAQNVRVTLKGARIAVIEPDTRPQGSDIRVDTLLPALANLHSHAFQRAMAGMSEFRQPGRDSFWTWRRLMYRFLACLGPDQIEAIAALAYMEMLEAGYGAVGEFHYVHHQPGGKPYANPAETSARIMAAAERAGIGLTHLPVLYSYGGAGKAALSEAQLRFFNTPEAYARLVDQVRAQARDMPADTRIGIAPHSLRATAPEDLAAILAAFPGQPTHIHIAEQPGEVADISAWLGARPVEWLLDNADVGTNWCLVHATHMTAEETTRLARSGAVAGLCPITEANLGDGPFNGPGFLAAGGAFGLGSDSNIHISLTEELRMLEYSQRLRDLARNVLVAGDGARGGSVGQTLYLGAAAGGARALARQSGAIEVGNLADLTAIDSQQASLCALSAAQLFDGLCFASDDRVVSDVWSAGRHMVRGGRHIHRAPIVKAYRAAVAALRARLCI